VPDEHSKKRSGLPNDIKDKRLPDAAIDLLDRTMAALGMINDTAVKDYQN